MAKEYDISGLEDYDISGLDVFDTEKTRALLPMAPVTPSGTDIAKSTLKGTIRDIGQIPASYINQLLLNLPRTAAKTYGLQYPEERGVTSDIAKGLSYGAGIAGGIVNPLSILRGGKVGTQMLRGALTAPLYGTEDMFKPGTIATKATVGAAIPMVSKGLTAAGKGLFNITKTGRDYIYNKIAEPASRNISSFVKSRPELVQKALKLKNETVDVLRKYGFERTSNPEALEEASTLKFHEAMGRKSNVYGDRINVKDTLGRMKSYYNSIKRVDPNNPILREIENLSKLQPAPEGFYKTRVPTSTQLGRQFKGENLIDIGEEVRLSRDEFVHLRRKIMDLYKRTDFDPKILDIADSLYDDAEKSGLKGMKEARGIWREFKEASSVRKDLSKLEKFTPEKIQNDIQSVITDKKKYKSMVDRYTPYMGEREARKIFDEALNVRQGEVTKRFLKRAAIGGAAASLPLSAFALFRNKPKPSYSLYNPKEE